MPSPERGSAAPGRPGRLGESLDRFRATRERTLEIVDGLSQAELDARPSPGRWSVGEVLDHLALSDALDRGEIETLIGLARTGERPVPRRSFADVDVGVLFLPKSLLPWLEPPLSLMSTVLPKALRDWVVRTRWLRAQNPAVGEPRPGRPAEELRRELREAPERFTALLAGAGDVDLASLRHFHPLLGWNDLAGIFSFMEGHERRHQGQLRELVPETSGTEAPGR